MAKAYKVETEYGTFTRTTKGHEYNWLVVSCGFNPAIIEANYKYAIASAKKALQKYEEIVASGKVDPRYPSMDIEWHKKEAANTKASIAGLPGKCAEKKEQNEAEIQGKQGICHGWRRDRAAADSLAGSLRAQGYLTVLVIPTTAPTEK